MCSSVKRSRRPSSDVRTGGRAYDVYVTNMFILSYLLVGLNGYSSSVKLINFRYTLGTGRGGGGAGSKELEARAELMGGRCGGN